MDVKNIRCHLVLKHADLVMQNHRVHGVSVMPGVVFLELSMRILEKRGLDPSAYSLERVRFFSPVATSETQDKELRVDISLPGDNPGSVTVFSRDAETDGPFLTNMRGVLVSEASPVPELLSVEAFKASATERIDMAELYRRARAENIKHGAKMRCAGTLFLHDGSLLAELELEVRDGSPFLMHPAALDATTIAAFGQSPKAFDDPFIPVAIDRFRYARKLPHNFVMFAPKKEILSSTEDLISNDYDVYDSYGNFCASFRRLACKRIRAPELIQRLLTGDSPDPTTRPASGEPASNYEQLLTSWIAALLRVETAAVKTGVGFYSLGLDSSHLLGIAERLEDELGLPVYPTLLFEHSNIQSLSSYLTRQYGEPPRPKAKRAIAPEPEKAFQGMPSSMFANIMWLPDPRGSSGGRKGRLLVAGMSPDDAEDLRKNLGPEWQLSTATEQAGSADVASYTCDAFILSIPARLDRDPSGLLSWAVQWVKRVARAAQPADIVFLAGEREIFPGFAGLAAFCRSVRTETPRLAARVLLVDGPHFSRALQSELCKKAEELPVTAGLIRYRGSEAEIQALAAGAAPVPAEGRVLGLGEGDVCVLSGGSGKIARHLCAWLLRAAPVRILLLGRRSTPPEWLAAEPGMAREGAVRYCSCDVTDPVQVAEILQQERQRGGRIRTVFHAAGIIADSLHLDLERGQIDATLAPKLDGFTVLDKATRNDPVALFVAFSSMAAWYPNPGQATYAFANAALEQLVEERAARGTGQGRTLSVAWPLWEDGGMQLDEALRVRASKKTGLIPLPTAQALKCLSAAIASPFPRLAVLYGDNATFSQWLVPPATTGKVPALESSAFQANTSAPANGTMDIAIVGLAGRFPDAADTFAFWDRLCRGHDSIREAPPDRWSATNHANDSHAASDGRAQLGGFLDDIEVFDAKMFNISRKEAERMDPQERLFLENCWTLLENAGHPAATMKGQDVGVYAGVMWNHYQLYGTADEPAPAAMHAAIANRVSYSFDLTGPSIAVDTACSSSLTTFGLAVDALRLGHCRMAIAGGVNLSVHPEKYRQLALGQFLSGSGHCRSFGAGGDGYVPGEGVGAVLLRPLRDALEDGDHIWAVVKACAMNHSGQTGGFTVPSPASQAAVIRQAWERGQIQADTISYIEAHGTGTALGDPIEIEGVVAALGENKTMPLPIGSVKSNIGHLESAAGIAAIAKVALMLQERQLVPSLHSAQLNPRLALEGTGISIVQSRGPWRTSRNGGKLRAGISSFGAGGANVHVVLEEYSNNLPTGEVQERPHIILLSAPDPQSLRDYAGRMRQAIQNIGQTPGSFDLMAWLAEVLGVTEQDIDPGDSLATLGLGKPELLRLRSLIGQDITMESRIKDLLAGQTVRPAEAFWLGRIAHQLQMNRSHLPARIAFLAGSLAEMVAALDAYERNGDAPGLIRAAQVTHADAAAYENLHEAGAWWVAGGTPDLSRLWPHPLPPKINLPVPGLSKQQRFWLGRWKAQNASPSATAVPATPAGQPMHLPLHAAARQQREEAVQPIANDGGIVRMELLQGGVALITMQDADNHNMFTSAMLSGLERAFAAVDASHEVRAVVLAGMPRVFSLGGTPDTLEKLARKEFSFTASPFLYEGLQNCQVPVIAAISGRATGGGLAFGLHADLVVMDRSGSYSANFVKFGFTPGLGATYILEHRFGPGLAHEMCLTGKDYSGRELEAQGARIRFVERDSVLDTAVGLARAIAESPANVIKTLKRDHAERVRQELPTVIQREVEMHQRVLDESAVPRIRARLQSFSAPQPSEARPAEAVKATPKPDCTEKVKDVIFRALRKAVYLDRDEIDPSKTFRELGLDSLGAVEIAREINEEFGRNFDSILVYEFPTIEALARKVAAEILPASFLAESPEPEPMEESFVEPQAAVARTPAEPVLLTAKDKGEEQISERTNAGPGFLVPRESAEEKTSRYAGVAPLALRFTLPSRTAESHSEPVPRLKVPSPASAPAPVRINGAPEESKTGPAPAPTPEGRSLARARDFHDDDIAIIGMSLRYPGSNTVEEFWENLRAGNYTIARETGQRWRNPDFYQENPLNPGLSDGSWVGFINDIERFDAAFFGISPREAELMDPQQRVFLEMAWRALEHSGYAVGPEQVVDCGVFVGTASGDYVRMLHQHGVGNSGQVFLGNSASVLAGRISYFLNLRGPSLALDTACSSSLVAVHLACQAILSGDCGIAIAGGIGLMVTPQMYTWNANSGMLSARGRCASFDDTADGFVLSEGVGLVVVKALRDAVRDRDQIHAVIKASGINGDGRTNGITAPSAEAQLALQRRVHARSHVPIDEIAYIETHGAGTQLGDPIEVKALGQLLQSRSEHRPPCGIGSVKSNIGHATLAAGVAGLIKVTLGLEHQTIPASLHFEKLNKNIDLDPRKIRVVSQAEPWRVGPSGLRYAAVNSFGVSGTNCHVVVCEAPEIGHAGSYVEDQAFLLPLSAKTMPALEANIRALREDLARGISLADAAFTLALGRAAFKHRFAVVARDRDQAIALLDAAVAERQLTGVFGRSGAPATAGLPDWRVGLSREDLMELAAGFCASHPIDFASFYAARKGQRVTLTGYALERRRFWLEPDERLAGTETGTVTKPAPTSLTETSAAPLSSAESRKLLEIVDTETAWVADHRVLGRHWLPGAAILHWTLDRAANGTNRVSSLEWLRHAGIEQKRGIFCAQTTESEKGAVLHFSLEKEAAWASAKVTAITAQAPEPLDYRREIERLPRVMPAEEFYRRFRDAGIDYGPSFHLVRAVHYGKGMAVAFLEPQSQPAIQLYDAILQTASVLVDGGALLVPRRIRQVTRYPHPVERTEVVRVSVTGPGQFRFLACDSHGTVTLEIDGFELAPLETPTTCGYLPQWKAYEVPAQAAAPAFARVTWPQTLAASVPRMEPGTELVLDLRDAPDDQPNEVLQRTMALLKRLAADTHGSTATLVTAGAAAIEPGDQLRPTQAALTALVRAAAAEGSFSRFHAVDAPVQTSYPPDSLPPFHPTLAEVSAYRGGVWYQPVFKPIPLQADAVAPIEDGKTYLIVGGTGGLGFSLSQELAGRHHAKLGWIGRQPHNASIARQISEIERLGGEAHYVSADVCDPTALAMAVREIRARLGPISGAYHSALVLEDVPVARMSTEQLAKVLRPKIDGIHALQAVLEAEPLNHLVIFSSVASFMQAPGQSNYAAASAYIDAFAEEARRRYGTPTFVVNWGYWGTVGVVSGEKYNKAMASLGIGSIEPADGFAWLRHQLINNLPHLMVINANPSRLAAFGLTVSDTPREKEREPKPLAESHVERHVAIRSESHESTRHAQSSDDDLKLEQVTEYVTKIFARVLKMDAKDFDVDTNFDSYGVDSLLAMDIVRECKRELGEIPSTLLYERLTITEIARYLLAEKQTALAARLRPQPVKKVPAPVPAPAPAPSPEPPVRLEAAQVAPEGLARAERLIPEQPLSVAVPAPVPARKENIGEIAVVGLVGRYPGADNVNEFWSNLRLGRRSITEAPPSRGDWKRFLAQKPQRNHTYNIHGGFLEDIALFDAKFFNILPSEAASMDPQERLFLALCWELLESSGHNGQLSREPETGVFIGSMYGGYGQAAAAQGWSSDQFDLGHSSRWSIANRVSYYFDFTGPSMCVDTACSSSMTAFHLACESLRHGECRQAIAGGVNVIVHPAHNIALSAMHMLGTGAACRTFDASANGMVPGEGLGAVLLRPLSDAIRDKDEILAVVRGSMVNAGGKTGGYTVPNPGAQSEVIRRAIERAGLMPQDIDCVEVHGTGTELGDPIEISALTQVFAGSNRRAPVWVSSVKSNIGHLEGAAGIAGITKAILQLRHQEMAPCAGLEKLNEKISFGAVQPVMSLTRWEVPADGPARPRICGVSSFGAGGANAHVLLSEFQHHDTPQGRDDQAGQPGGAQHLFLLSATDEEQLRRYAALLAQWVGDNPNASLPRLCFTSQTGRKALPVRAALVISDLQELAHNLALLAAGQPSEKGTTPAQAGKSTLLSGEVGQELASLFIARRQLAELSQLWLAGVPIDWRGLWPLVPGRCAYPTLPLNRTRYWFQESARTQARDLQTSSPANTGPDTPWLAALAAEHRIGGRCLVPGAALLELAIAHAEQHGATALRDFRWHRPLVVEDIQTEPRIELRGDTTRAGLHESSSNLLLANFRLEYELSGSQEAARSIGAQGEALQTLTGEEYYAKLHAGGFTYGRSLQTISSLEFGGLVAVARLKPVQKSGPGAVAGLLDGAMQTAAILCKDAALPSSVDQYRQYQPLVNAVTVVTQAEAARNTFHIQLLDIEGRLVASLIGLHTVAIKHSRLETGESTLDYLRVVETATPLAEDKQAPRRVLLLARDQEVRIQLAAELASIAIPAVLSLDELEEGTNIDAVILCLSGSGEAAAERLSGYLDQLFRTTDAVRRHRGAGPVRFIVATRASDIAGRAVAGATRSLDMENPWLTISHLTLQDWDLMTALVRECIHADKACPEIILTPTRRLSRNLESFAISAADGMLMRPGGTYVITGGAGTLGRHFAAHMARKMPATVVLLGRREATDELTAWLAQHSQNGSRLIYRQADICDETALSKLFGELTLEFGPLRGILHAAGISCDALAKNKTLEQIRKVLAPKVTGTMALERCSAGHPLDFFLLCSSLAAETGNIGQADYAAGNRFLADFAAEREQQRHAGLRKGKTVVVAWPLWRDGGMTVDSATETLFAEQFGMLPLETADGLAALDLALTGNLPYFAPLRRATQHQAAAAPPQPVVPARQTSEFAPEPTALSEVAPGSKLTAFVLDRLREIAAEYLLVEPRNVELDSPLLEMGFDSISVTEIVNKINSAYSLDLLPSVLFECPTFSDVARYLVQEHGRQIAVFMPQMAVENPSSVSKAAAPPVAPVASNGKHASLEPADQHTYAARDEAVASNGKNPSPEHPPAAAFHARPADDAIAIIGMAGRFAAADSLPEFWRKLVNNEEFLGSVDESHPELLKDTTTARVKAGFLSNIDQFAAAAFGISPREAALMDPQQRLFIETAYEAVQDAGYSLARLRGREIGVFAGVSTSDYNTLLAEAGVSPDPHMATGISHAILANRVSYIFDWTGPSEVMDTACSSSLVAFMRAVEALRRDECELACVGGVNVLLSPGLFRAFDRSGMLSKDHRCKTFDAAADGYVRGEGVGVVLLRPFSDALRDGDHIYAIVRGGAVNHTGKSTSLTAPNPLSQARVIRKAIAAAGVDPHTIGFIETHGTGTRLGDLVEIEGLKLALRNGKDTSADWSGYSPRIRLGALKTAIGHVEAAAGIAGVIRTALSLKHNYLFANKNLHEINPDLRLQDSPFTLLTEHETWTRSSSEVRRAGVSSFGFGGTNAHVILESFPGQPQGGEADLGPFLVPVSAPDLALLRQYAATLSREIERTQPAPANIAFTLQQGRDSLKERALFLVDTLAHLQEGLRALERGSYGGGSVWVSEQHGGMIPARSLAMAQSWLSGNEVAWPLLRAQRCSLPPAPFDRKRHWFQAPETAPHSGPAANGRGMSSHDSEPGGIAPSSKISLDALPQQMEGSGPARNPSGKIMLDVLPEPPRTIEVSGSSSATVPARPAPAPLEDMEAHLIRTLSAILLVWPESIPMDRSFSDLGLDSILRMDFARSLNASHGLELSGADLYEYDTISKLKSFLQSFTSAAAHNLGTAAHTSSAAAHSAAAATPVTGTAAHAPSAATPTADGAPVSGAAISPVAAHSIAETNGRPVAHAELSLFLCGLVKKLTSIEMRPDQEFAHAGLTSFDMLKVIADLERVLGPLAKTLLFDFPTPGTLDQWLCGAFDAALLARLVSGFAPTRTSASSLGKLEVLESGAIVISKKNLPGYPEIQQAVERMEIAWAKEQGLPGRDIAPYLFIGADRIGFLHFAERDGLLLSWNSCVEEVNFVQLVAQWTAWAYEKGFRPNLLSLVPLDKVAERSFCSTPFGTVQRLRNLAGFTLEGGAMNRLRKKVNTFSRSGEIAVVEYAIGSDSGTDARIVELIDQWAERKDMVNPYVHRVRSEIRNGLMGEHHRVFLMRVNGLIVATILITKIRSENGYLLDLEFFSNEMSNGGLDYAIVEILRKLQGEGVAMFSFGATLGVRICDAPNSHPEVERALDELRKTGLFRGDGNFQFKNKYRTENLPIYLSQPADVSVADVSPLLLLIANPVVALDEEEEQDSGSTAPARPQAHTMPNGQATRESLQWHQDLQSCDWNALLIPNSAHNVNLVTDSWAERDDAFIREREQALSGDVSWMPGSEIVQDTLPFSYLHATSSGKAAEALLLKTLNANHERTIIQTHLFPSWTFNCLDLGYSPVLVNSCAKTGEIDLQHLDSLLQSYDAGLCCFELTPNALAGPGLALESLRAASALVKSRGVPLIFDAARGLSNAWQVSQETGLPFWDAVKQVFSLATAVTISLSKEFGLRNGGLIATSDDFLIRSLKGRVRDRGHDVGLAERRLIEAALHHRDWLQQAVGERIARMRQLARCFEEFAVPLKASGLHALLIDASALHPGSPHAVASILAWLYHLAGIKASPHLASGRAETRHTVRFTVPVGMKQPDFDALLASLRAGLASRTLPKELSRISGPDEHPVRYVPRDILPEDIAEELASPGPSVSPDANWRVIQAWQPSAKRHIVPYNGGEIEVFEAGSGRPLILLHPFNIGAGFFAPQFKTLAKTHRVIVIHAPGAGKTTAARDLSFDGLSELVMACAEALSVEQPFTLAGASFGGLTALSVAYSNPDSLNGLVLFGCSYKVGNRKGEINRLDIVVEQDCKALEAANCQNQLTRQELLALLEECKTMDPRTGLRYLDVFAQRPNLLEKARKLQVPVLLVHGQHDTVISLEIARTLADAVPRARLVTIENAGHFPSLTCHDQTNSLVAGFTKELVGNINARNEA